MRIYPTNRVVIGAKKEECDRCGFDFLDVELITEHRTNLRVCKKCYDPVHPQDNVNRQKE